MSSTKKPSSKPASSSTKDSKKSSKKTVEDLFADIDDAPISSKSAKAPARKDSSKVDDDEEKRLMAELEGLTAEKRTPSRPVTPRVGPRTSTDSQRRGVSERASFEERKTVTTAGDPEKRALAAEEEERGESSASAAAAAAQQGEAGGGGWWGGLWNTASAAVETAQGVYKEIQSSEETKKWSEQVRGNVQALKGLGGELQKRAIPTFSTLLSHIAPPISSHERLRIHTTHDLIAYPSIDPIVYNVFSRVMQQVDGGELMVIQRGSESTAKSNSVDSLGWGGGPWWRDEQRKRDLSACTGIKEGVKLAKANAEGFATEYLGQAPTSPTFKKDPEQQQQQKAGEKEWDPNNPVRKSDVFLAVQALTYPTPDYLAPKTAEDEEDEEEEEEGGEDGEEEGSDDDDDESESENLLAFALHLTDPRHKLSFTAVSQAVPAKWGAWLDGTFDDLPEDVQAALAAGAVDPREWIAEWVEETLALTIGVVAQSYVSKRMGVGEGMGKGKAPARVDAEMAGEEARVVN